MKNCRPTSGIIFVALLALVALLIPLANGGARPMRQAEFFRQP